MRGRKTGQMRVLIPILFFVVLALLLMGITAAGAGIYARFQSKSENYFSETTFSDYMRTKIGAADAEGGIRIGKFGSGDALFLTDAAHSDYETVLYVQNGYLMEEYKSVSADVSPDAGNKILKADDFAVAKLNDKCVRCSLKQGGQWQDADVFAAGGIETED